MSRMSEGTLQPATDSLTSCTFEVEHTVTLITGLHRHSIKFSDFPRVSTLKSLFSSVALQDVVAEVRQDTFVSSSDGFIAVNGHIFIAIIPTTKDTDSASGATSVIVSSVPNKQTFPLHESSQGNEIFKFNLTGYELDLAQDPRRGAGPVAWLGNSGVTKVGTAHKPICSVTWRIKVVCSGATPLWQ